MIQRHFANILSDDLPASKEFYTGLLGMELLYDSDWFIDLATGDAPRFELGILARHSDLVPEGDRHPPQGMMLTFVVDDVERVFEAAQAQGVTIIEPPRDLFYGQRRLLLRDPNGVLVDVSTPSGQAG